MATTDATIGTVSETKYGPLQITDTRTTSTGDVVVNVREMIGDGAYGGTRADMIRAARRLARRTVPSATHTALAADLYRGQDGCDRVSILVSDR